MDHADVRIWLDEAFFVQAGSERDEATTQAVDQHLSGCADCAAYSRALSVTALKLDLARGPSPATRERVLAAVRAVGRPASSAPPASAAPTWWQRLGGLRLAAAGLAIAIVGAGLGAAWAESLRPPTPDTERLVAAVAMMARMAGEAQTHEMVLHDDAGREAGLALMSTGTHEMAIFTAALEEPSQGGYRCYLERQSGERMMIGPMHFSDGVGFWAGPMASDIEGQPGDRLVVASDEDAPAMLSAPL